jgi:hypothetical protein
MRLAASLAVVLGLSASAGLASPLAIELISPRPGAAWRAGERVTIEWRLAGDWPRGLEVEEWEAFLSLDGGASYPVRLTPHLERDIRSVSFVAPGLPTSNARLLLRFGDERREVEWSSGAEFAIAGSDVPLIPPRQAVGEAGEAPRPGDPGVVRWTDGARDGGGWRVVESRRSVLHGRAVIGALSEEEPAAESESPTTLPRSERSARGARWVLPRLIANPAGSVRSVSILRLIERQNE